MFVTPQHQVKKLRNEAGRNIVGGTMLCPELGRGDVGRYIEIGQRGKERREEQDEGEGREERKGKKEIYICIHMYQCLYTVHYWSIE